MSIRYGPALQIHEIGVGCILWLPPYSDFNGDCRPLCERQTCMPRHSLDENGFDHPVVVLNTYDLSDSIPSIQFLTLTSKNLSNRGYSTPLRHGSLSQVGTNYSLESRQNLLVASHFRLEHTFKLNLSRFDAYDWGQAKPYDYRLTHQSYKRLMKNLGLDANYFHPTSDIKKGLLQAPPPAPPPLPQQLQIMNRRRENNLYAYLELEEC
ncbi:hypothetical protein BOTCAL_0312g00080 [Botryotinia calthae]|uniref:Uncharacterized protein n=1 Tax=Botryotinia calthae TaxID=38488 RepID=A0A4Y8CWJ2_9HELO|nr:hypothetical protein BOTCAL_0312g00080 [Botryotinia calthae]